MVTVLDDVAETGNYAVQECTNPNCHRTFRVVAEVINPKARDRAKDEFRSRDMGEYVISPGSHFFCSRTCDDYFNQE
jgi:hypothetical protein